MSVVAFAKDPSAEQRQLEKKVEHLETRLAKKDAVIAEVTGDYVKQKRTWGALTGRWLPHDLRAQVVDFVGESCGKADTPSRRAPQLTHWMALCE